MALPPGPREPSALQLARWLNRHIPFLERCRRRYGEAFTLRFAGVGTLVFASDPESAKRLFSADREHSLPDGRSVLLEPILGRRSVLLLEGAEHMRRRKLMLPPFHGERMRAYETVITEAVEAEISRWPRGSVLAIRGRMQAITLEVILRAVFGVETGSRHDDLRDGLSRVLGVARRPAAQALGHATRPLGRRGP